MNLQRASAQLLKWTVGHSKTENIREHDHVEIHTDCQSTHKKKNWGACSRVHVWGARSMTYYRKMTQRSDSARPEPIVRREWSCTLWGLWTLGITYHGHREVVVCPDMLSSNSARWQPGSLL